VKAVVQTGYGPPEALELRDVSEPTFADDEVLVRMRAASVHPDVWHVVTGRPYLLRLMGSGLRRPRDVVPGTDVAGTVEAVGANVTRFRPGDAVFGETVRGYQWRNGGAYAEFVSVPADQLAAKPADVTFEQAACVPTSGLIALPNLRAGGPVTPGQRVLVNGAGGGVGTIAVQLAKGFGATVTAVDTGAKLDLLRELGADHVIDYTVEDFTRGPERYDLIFDVPGNRSLSECRRVLASDGTYVLIGHDRYGAEGRRVLGSVPRVLGLTVRAPFTRALPKASFSLPPKHESMAVLADALADGTLTPIVDRTFPLAEAGAAIRYLAGGRALGRVLVTP
jgi:NADPH:quinone reductase-like Zn-dependent oxidoreductase